MLVGNNCHLESERIVSTEEGKNTAGSVSLSHPLTPPHPSYLHKSAHSYIVRWGAGFIEVSAKTRKNVPEIFEGVVRLIDVWRVDHPPVLRCRRRIKSTRFETCLLL
jgi:hypothetical protein